MLKDLFRKLFGHVPPTADVAKRPGPAVEPAAASFAKADIPVEATKAIPPAPLKAKTTGKQQPKVSHARIPIDLDIGLDLGTSCTKAVIGDRENNRQTAVPLNEGHDLRGYLLPTRVFLENDVYSLVPTANGSEQRGLKMRILESTRSGHGLDPEALADLTVFAALVIRRILGWYHHELAKTHRNREPVWHLNIGLPSQGGPNDQFAPIYRRLIRAAVAMVPGDAPITRTQVLQQLGSDIPDSLWLPDNRLNTFPEAGAQLASLILSPHRPSGCLLVVDVGAGTMDISTLRIGGDKTSARCTLHVCEVAPLGVHYLYLARRGIDVGSGLSPEVLSQLPTDDGIHAVPRGGLLASPPQFVDSCRQSILPVVSCYRKRLKGAHENQAFRPWVDGLPYVLSGGGHRDPFYQDLLKDQLPRWLYPVVSEWDDSQHGGRHRSLIHQSFPIPRSFAPKILLKDFDRFSVAHGLSLGADGLMEMRAALR